MTKTKVKSFFIKRFLPGRLKSQRLYPVLFILACLILHGWDFRHPLKQTNIPEKKFQYVCVAFDGAGFSPFWEESLKFAKNHNAHFTYFVSGVFLLSPHSKIPERQSKTYQGPAGSYSKIGWGKSDTEIDELLAYLKRAMLEGHDVGSHAMGHFHGGKWSEAQWDKELKEFEKVWINVVQLPTANLVGFRSPYLDKNAAMYRSLKKFGFTYDTSDTAPMDTYPTRNVSGVWVFPLAEVPIANSRARTISMDYNFFYYDVRRPRHLGETLALKKERMLQSYRNYFYHNYNGSRAPVHIGHHFQTWNKNIYQEALFEWLEEISKLSDVKIVSYRELTYALEKNQKR